MQSFYRWAVVPEWCRCLFFYDAAVFLYSSIERNDTRNFREKKIFRVALSGTLEVKRVNHILYIICLYIIYSHIIYIYNIVFCSCSFSLMFYGINFFPYSSYWVRQQDALKCILKVRMYFNLRHVSASAMLTKVELPKR